MLLAPVMVPVLAHVDALAAAPYSLRSAQGDRGPRIGRHAPRRMSSAFATAALVLGLTGFMAEPGLAWGKKEQGFIAGAAAAIIIDRLLTNPNQAQAQTYSPPPQQLAPPPAPPAPPRAKPPVHTQKPAAKPKPGKPPSRHHHAGSANVYPHAQAQEAHNYGPYPYPGPGPGPAYATAPGKTLAVNATSEALVYKSYSSQERRNIQRNLANLGYYRGSIDGLFGPGTYTAITQYARQNGMADYLNTQSGLYALYNSLAR